MSEKKSRHLDNARLHNELENVASNSSANRSFQDILNKKFCRRKLMSGSLSFAVTSLFLTENKNAIAAKKNPLKKLVNFKSVTVKDIGDGSMPAISEDYQYQVLIPWGTPIEPSLTKEYKGNPKYRPTPHEANLQTGLGHDGMWFFPIDTHEHTPGNKNSKKMSSSEGIMCINHEFGTNSHALGKDAPENIDDVRLSQHIHGVSVIGLEQEPKTRQWKVKKSPNARRITVNSPVTFSGPAAQSKFLKNPNGNIPLGTINNCGNGKTPWGTYLTCEENFNGYFGANGDFTPSKEQKRYGLTDTGFAFNWHKFDARFDLNNPGYINENHRFGWVVEIDPFDAKKKPIKRTAMGRFKHEAVAIAEDKNGHIAAYMGDDQRFDYCYRYVSNKPWKTSLKKGESPLDDGKLFVAKFNDDNSGEWLELSIENPKLAKRFSSQAELLVYTRVAADLVGATPMDRPEWTSIGKNGEIFWSLTNNSKRTVANAANPEAPNDTGHIIRMLDHKNHTGNRFEWDIFILASSTNNTDEVFSNPDAAHADTDGRLFIGTDGNQPESLRNQLVVFDTTEKQPKAKRLFVGVKGNEITGFTITPDQKTAFINIQHPGDGSPKETNFPKSFDGVTIPRDCTIVITRKDGGVVGS